LTVRNVRFWLFFHAGMVGRVGLPCQGRVLVCVLRESVGQKLH
jgi:predicted thioredoxin/glutaredoxin